jgi:hypothetical protein
MGRRFMRTKEVVDLCKDIGMGIRVEERDRFTPCQFATAQRLHNASGDGMIAHGGNRARTRSVDAFVEIRDLLDAVFVVIGPRKRNVPHIGDLGGRDDGSVPETPCTRRCTAETLRDARGPRCWSRSVVPLRVEWGTPTRAMSCPSGGRLGAQKNAGMPHR